MVDDATLAGSSSEKPEDLSALARQRFEQGAYLAALAPAEQALARYSGGPAGQSEAHAAALHQLAEICSKLGSFSRARELAEQALDLRRRLLGDRHPETLASLFLLADATGDCGEIEASIALVEQAYAQRVEVLGHEHPDTLENRAVLGLLLNYQSRRREAEQHVQNAWQACQRALPELHRTRGRVLNALGVLAASRERSYDEARRAYEQAMAIYEALLGPEHMDVAGVMNNLAAVLIDLDQPERARPLLERSLAIHERSIGLNNIQSSFVMNNLAALLQDEDEPERAIALLKRALVACQQSVGAYHPQTIATLRSLTGVLGDLDGPDMALAMSLSQCLSALEEAEGEPPGPRQRKAAEQLQRLIDQLAAELERPAPSPETQAQQATLRTLGQEAAELQQQGSYAEAEQRLEQTLALQELLLGPSHLDHVKLLEQLVELKQAQRQLQAARALQERIISIYREQLGPAHPQTMLAQTELMSYGMGLEGLLAMSGQLADDLENSHVDPRQAQLFKGLNQMIQGMMDDVSGLMDPALQGDEKDRPAPRRWEPGPAHAAYQAEMLEGLDEIAWGRLTHAYGSAEQVPDMLRMLISEDEDEREEAREALGSTIAHQGTLYSATAAVVPFLLRMAAHPDTPERESILAYLAFIADASRAPAAADDRRATHEALLALVPQLLELCEHDETLRLGMVVILAGLHERRAEIVPALSQLLEREQDPGMQATLLLALAELIADEREALRLFASQLVASPVVRFVAAAALIERTRERAPAEAVQIILQSIARVSDATPRQPSQQELNALFEQGGMGSLFDALSSMEEPALVWEGGDETRHGAFWHQEGLTAGLTALAKLGRQRGLPLLLQVLPALPDGDAAAQLLLALAFDLDAGLERRPGRSLHEDGQVDVRPANLGQRAVSYTGEQRAVLEALAGYTPIWQQDHNPLTRFGLPSTPQLLRQILSSTTQGTAARPTTPMSAPAVSQAPPLSQAQRAERLAQIEQAYERAGVAKKKRKELMAYLRDDLTLGELWHKVGAYLFRDRDFTHPPQDLSPEELELRQFETFHMVTKPISQPPLALSTGPSLDELDLRQLEIFYALNSPELFIARLADQERVLQAYEHLLQAKHPYPLAEMLQEEDDDVPEMFREQARALATSYNHELVQAFGASGLPYLRDGKPSALGRLIVEWRPELLPQIVAYRRQQNSASVEDLVALLLAFDPPYADEARRLM